MAKTYYGYVERNAGDFVNWSAIGENLVQVIQEEGRRRIAIKEEIDKADREWGNILVNPPQGLATKFNEWALDAANQGSAYRLMTTRLLKSGKMSLNDYLVSRQNAIDGYAGLFDLIKEYNAEAESRINDYNNGKTAALDMDVMGDIESFANYSKTGIYINPVNGEVNIAFKDETTDANGNKIYTMSNNPNKFSTVNSLQNRIKTRYNKFDVKTSMDQMYASMGTHLEVIEKVRATTGKQGQFWSYTDPMLKKNLPKNAQGAFMKFEEAETMMLNSYLNNNFNTASVLTDYKGVDEKTGKTFGFTWDAAEAAANSNLILKKLDDNGNLVLQISDEQKNQAREYLRVEARMRYDRQEAVSTTGTTPFAPQRMPTPKDPEDLSAMTVAKEIAALLTGTQELSDAAAYYFGTQGIVIDKKGSALTISGKPVTMPSSGLTPFDFATSLIPALNPQGINQTKIMNHLKQYLGGSLNLTSSSASPSAPTPKSPYDKASYESFINTNLYYANGDNSIVEDDPTLTAKNLNNKFNRLGFTFKGQGVTDDEIVIYGDNGASATFAIDDAGQSLEAIKQWMRENPQLKKAAAAFAPK